MKICSIPSQNFQARKFRLPVKAVEMAQPGFSATEKVNWVKEFSNPKAEVLYKKAMETSDLKEKMRLFEQMGEYRVFDIEKEVIIDSFIEKISQAKI